MNRRQVLRALGVGSLGVLTGCAEQAQGVVQDFEGTPTPYEWPATEELNGPFTEATYYENGKAEIALDPFHEIDGYVLMYSEYSEVENAIQSCRAPTGDSPTISLNLRKLINRQNRDYPDTEWKIIGANGVFNSCPTAAGFTLVREQVHTAWLHLPSQWFSNESESEADRTLTPQENTTVGFGE